MVNRFKVGDHVISPGFKFKDEADRYGEVVECYEGQRDATGHREQMVAVRFDDTGLVERGFLQIGRLQHEPLRITRMLGV